MPEHQLQEHRFDLLLKGGHVIDPANEIDGPIDVGIRGRQIVLVAERIPSDRAGKVLDATGCYVVPGLLDIHAHVYTFPATPNYYVLSINADAHCLASGVTTVVDTGSAGWQYFLNFRATCIDRAKTRILAFLNIARGGMLERESEQNLVHFEPGIAAAIAREHSDVVVGIKTAHYWTSRPWDSEHPPWASVEKAVEAGEICGKPVMVDFWPRSPERSYPDLLLKKLRPGDIHTHVFAQQFPILDEQRHIREFMIEARERGIRFDMGHGAASFWFRQAVPAFRDGFPPDSISTDLHMGNINGNVFSMLHTMSKCLCMEMPLPEVIRRATVNPASLIGHPELGTLSVGSEADVALLQLRRGTFHYIDCGKAVHGGDQKLECVLTLRAGEIVYNPAGLGLPRWEEAPEPYWRAPRS